MLFSTELSFYNLTINFDATFLKNKIFVTLYESHLYVLWSKFYSDMSGIIKTYGVHKFSGWNTDYVKSSQFIDIWFG